MKKIPNISFFDRRALWYCYHMLRIVCLICASVTIISLCTIPDAEAQQVKISGFTDISLGTWNGSGNLSGENSLCVYNEATPDYRVRARGSGAGNSFMLNGSDSDLAYQVRFKESSGSYVSLTADTFQNFTGADTDDIACGGSNNANLEVIVTSDALSAAASGSYSGTLTVLLETL